MNTDGRSALHKCHLESALATHLRRLHPHYFLAPLSPEIQRQREFLFHLYDYLVGAGDCVWEACYAYSRGIEPTESLDRDVIADGLRYARRQTVGKRRSSLQNTAPAA